MKTLLTLLAIAVASTAALAGADNFDHTSNGAPPPEWTCGVTGKGLPIWKIESDSPAPSKPNVLEQSGSGTFPWCVKN